MTAKIFRNNPPTMPPDNTDRTVTDNNPPDIPDTPAPDTPVMMPETPVPLTDLPEEPVPLADIPEEEVPLTEIPEDPVPLAFVPATGDISGLWYLLTALSACGLLVLKLLGKREEESED